MTNYAASIVAYAAAIAADLSRYKKFFWTWRRLLTTVEPPGGCVGPLDLVSQAEAVATGISQNANAPDGDLYQSAMWLFSTLRQLQEFKKARVAVFGTCSWAP